ncbi:uncharacterized protein LOC143290019 [Babylonia areolata]|uniref:uncharacterized protein LOC143290019 n=1 Tax=Babylonia areolata TaxID=304850 RepID=UPI003FCF264E
MAGPLARTAPSPRPLSLLLLACLLALSNATSTTTPFITTTTPLTTTTVYDCYYYDYFSEFPCWWVDCETPRCWNSRKAPGDCCPLCPDGDNCIVPASVVNRAGMTKRNRTVESIPFGEDRVYGQMVCRCDDSKHENYKKMANCWFQSTTTATTQQLPATTKNP